MRYALTALTTLMMAGPAAAATFAASGAGTVSGTVAEYYVDTGTSVVPITDAPSTFSLYLQEVADPDLPHTLFSANVCTSAYTKACFVGGYDGPFVSGFLTITDSVNRRVLDFGGSGAGTNNSWSGSVVIDYDNGIPVFASGQIKGQLYFYQELYDISYDVTFSGAVNSFSGDLAPPPVPEPATWAMMLGGFFVAGSAMRTQRSASAMARPS